MSVRKVRIEEYTCDGCGKIQYGELGDSVNGLRGRIFEAADWGGNQVEVFACSRDCLAPAITTALDRRD